MRHTDMRLRRILRNPCLLALAVSVSDFVGAADPDGSVITDSGKGSFVFDNWEGPPLKVWYYYPESTDSDSTIVLVLHGAGRDGDRYRDQWTDVAEEGEFLVVAPAFPAKEFPGVRQYNLGNVYTPEGELVDEAEWTFSAIEPLFDAKWRRVPPGS